ncbi:MAG: imidazoleglycerol-phosphate dehydratase HisB [Lachnospiraceae bacterium]|nr:imidazoleglycerol-phosphate dehydratase HisB [Lachnospiraceae bacterium]
MNKRLAKISRKTKETDITCELILDGTGKSDINTGIGFFDHMLEGFAKHGLFDLFITCRGDLEVDAHHSVEDTGIVLGQAIEKALGDKKGIRRYGHFLLPMDDALIACAIDLCGRPYFNFDLRFPEERCGDMEMSLIREFFYAVSYSSMMNLHLKQLDGLNSHHIAEAASKAFAKSLDMASGYDERIEDVLSTKGAL